MKRTTFIMLAIVIMPLTLKSQQNSIDQVFRKYAGITGITSVQISSGMFSMLAGMDSDNKDLQDLAKSVTSVYILHAPEETAKIMNINFYNEVIQDIPLENYNELMRVNSTDQQVIILADEYDGVIRELLMLVGGDSDNALISIKGSIDMRKIASLSQIGAPGMEHFMNMQE